MLEESVKYSLERKTFGVPIGRHQAVSFMLAEMAIGISFLFFYFYFLFLIFNFQFEFKLTIFCRNKGVETGRLICWKSAYEIVSFILIHLLIFFFKFDF